MSNKDHADRAANTLLAGGYISEHMGLDNSIADLIADLLHLAEQNGLDTEHITERALWHQSSERADALLPGGTET